MILHTHPRQPLSFQECVKHRGGSAEVCARTMAAQQQAQSRAQVGARTWSLCIVLLRLPLLEGFIWNCRDWWNLVARECRRMLFGF